MQIVCVCYCTRPVPALAGREQSSGAVERCIRARTCKKFLMLLRTNIRRMPQRPGGEQWRRKTARSSAAAGESALPAALPAGPIGWLRPQNPSTGSPRRLPDGGACPLLPARCAAFPLRAAPAKCVPILFSVPVTNVRLTASAPTRASVGFTMPIAALSRVTS